MFERAAWILAVGLAACSSESSNAPASGGGGSASGGQAGAGATGGSSAGGTAGTGAGGTAGATGGTPGDSGTDAPVSCTTASVSATLTADTMIFPEGSVAAPNCDQTITAGASYLLAVGGVTENASRALLRFQLTGLGGKTIKSAKLVVKRDQGVGKDYGCGASGACGNTGGPITVYPLTTKWVEGTSAGGTGANWCYGKRDDKTMKWSQNGADGSSDRGSAAGIKAHVKDADVLEVTLDPAVLEPWANTDVSPPELNLLMVSGGATLFFYSKEHPEHGADAAKLMLEVCQ